MSSSVYGRSAAAFKTNAPAPPDLGEHAEAGRSKMVDPFCAWVCQKRHEVEVAVLQGRRWVRECRPFAEAVMPQVDLSEVHGPDRDYQSWEVVVPAVVWEYASAALSLSKLEARLAMLNIYYFDAATAPVESGVTLHVTEANEATVRTLWGEYMAEQGVDED